MCDSDFFCCAGGPDDGVDDDFAGVGEYVHDNGDA